MKTKRPIGSHSSTWDAPGILLRARSAIRLLNLPPRPRLLWPLFLQLPVHYTAVNTVGWRPQDLGPCIVQDVTVRHYFFNHMISFISLVIHLLEKSLHTCYLACLPAQTVNSLLGQRQCSARFPAPRAFGGSLLKEWMTRWGGRESSGLWSWSCVSIYDVLCAGNDLLPLTTIPLCYRSCQACMKGLLFQKAFLVPYVTNNFVFVPAKLKRLMRVFW